MTLLSKRQGAFGICYETVPGTAEDAPAYWIPCDSFNIESTPSIYERTNNLTENKIGIEAAGQDHSFSFSGAQLDVETMGYLLWLFFADGSTDTTTSPHTITAEYSSHYFTVFKDHGGVFDGTNEVERLAGCRFGNLSIDQPRANYATISGDGMGLSLSPLGSLSAPTLPNLGPDNAPLSWATLRAGSFDINWNDGGSTASTYPTSLKFNFSREIDRQGADLNSNDPSAIVEGGRMLDFEFTLDNETGVSDVSSAIAALKGGQPVAIDVTWVSGTTSLKVDTSNARITGSVSGEVGAGSETQMLTIPAEVYDTGSGLATITATDGVDATYASRNP
jgi:hypothetical protein